jgi:hypothetical protein
MHKIYPLLDYELYSVGLYLTNLDRVAIIYRGIIATGNIPSYNVGEGAATSNEVDYIVIQKIEMEPHLKENKKTPTR